jgi:hypothetical protein
MMNNGTNCCSTGMCLTEEIMGNKLTLTSSGSSFSITNVLQKQYSDTA